MKMYLLILRWDYKNVNSYCYGMNFGMIPTAESWGPWDNAPHFTDLFSLSDFMISFYEYDCCISLSFLQGTNLFLPS